MVVDKTAECRVCKKRFIKKRKNQKCCGNPACYRLANYVLNQKYFARNKNRNMRAGNALYRFDEMYSCFTFHGPEVSEKQHRKEMQELRRIDKST